MIRVRSLCLWTALALGAGGTWAQDKPVYKCPGNLYTDTLSAKEAIDKGCKTLEGNPITVIQGPRPRAKPEGPVATAGTPRPADQKVEPTVQRERDADARRILEAELQREEARLNEMRKEYNNGEPERRGDERNYQKYVDRTAELKANLARKESDVAAIKRELAKLR